MNSKIKFLIESLKEELDGESLSKTETDELISSLKDLIENKAENPNADYEFDIDSLSEDSSKTKYEPTFKHMSLFDSENSLSEKSELNSKEAPEFHRLYSEDLFGNKEDDLCLERDYSIGEELMSNSEPRKIKDGRYTKNTEFTKYIFVKKIDESFVKLPRRFTSVGAFNRVIPREQFEYEKDNFSTSKDNHICVNEYFQEKHLNRRHKFKEIIESNTDFMFNQRCRNVLSTLLLWGPSYLDFVEYSFSKESDTQVYIIGKFNSVKTREIFTQLFNYFEVSFDNLKSLIEKCFNRYNMSAYSDFRFGNNFKFFWECCINREKIDSLNAVVFPIRDKCTKTVYPAIENIKVDEINTTIIDRRLLASPKTLLGQTYLSLFKHSAYYKVNVCRLAKPLINIWRNMKKKQDRTGKESICCISEPSKAFLYGVFTKYSLDELYEKVRLFHYEDAYGNELSESVIDELFNVYKQL